MDNVVEGGAEEGVTVDVLEEHRGKIDHGVETGRDTDDDQAGRDKTMRAPDVERYDRVIDLVLDKDKGDEEDQADDEWGQSLGGCPTADGGLGQVEDDADDTGAKGKDVQIVNAAVGDRGFALGGGNDDKAEDD